MTTSIYTGSNTKPSNKYHQWYLNIIHNRQINLIHREDQYCEKHHIVPKSLGGSDESSNLVNLTAREHFIVHILLTKFLTGPSKHKMLNALIRFRYSGNQYYTSRLYEASRLEMAKFKSYRNITTQEYQWFENDPGELWIQEGINKGRTQWYNVSTGEYIATRDCPGEGWIKQGVNTGKSFWYNEASDIYIRSVEHPGSGWIKKSPKKGTSSWYNENTNEFINSSECPGEGWVNKGINGGTNHYTYTGNKYCIGDYGCFTNSYEIYRAMNKVIGRSTIQRMIDDPEKLVTNYMYTRAKFLHTLGSREELVGNKLADVLNFQVL